MNSLALSKINSAQGIYSKLNRSLSKVSRSNNDILTKKTFFSVIFSFYTSYEVKFFLSKSCWANVLRLHIKYINLPPELPSVGILNSKNL